MSDALQSQSLNQSLSEEIAFLRALATEGQNNRYRGDIGLAAALIWGSASLYDWAVWTRLIRPIGGAASVGWVWIVALVVFMAVGFPLGLFRRSGNRAMGAAWAALGVGSWTITAGIALAAWRTHQGIMFTLLPPIVMALYGGAWLLSAAVVRRRWMTGVAVASLLASLALAYTVAQPLEYLLFALALYSAGVPGLASVLRGRSKG